MNATAGRPHPLGTVQRIVLKGGGWEHVAHLLLQFNPDARPRASVPHLLQGLMKLDWPMAAGGPEQGAPDKQMSIGFTRWGLEKTGVPDWVLVPFMLKAPAFWAGAAQRAALHLGLIDGSAPQHWWARGQTLHLVVSLHAQDNQKITAGIEAVKQEIAKQAQAVRLLHRMRGARLPAPPEHVRNLPASGEPKPMWVHFGYRDGLSRIGIEGWSSAQAWKQCLPTSRHRAGEFVLGHARNSGANPWIAGPRQRVWPQDVRRFFHNGSFGVLQQIEQDVDRFEQEVQRSATALGVTENIVKGYWCGRTPGGMPLAVSDPKSPEQDFDYSEDPAGERCPFGSHVRRMNPRLPEAVTAGNPPDTDEAPQADESDKAKAAETPLPALAHSSRARPLLRRGLPYGPARWQQPPPDAKTGRGLLGHFFCASIEDQYEHLLGQWADRVPLGSLDRGGARDPLIGLHQPGDGPFHLPGRLPPRDRLHKLQACTRTLGVAYLFYPSLVTLKGLVDADLWARDDASDPP